MNYFVTGGTGFVGRFLLERLLERGGDVYVLTRSESVHKLDALNERHGDLPGRLIGVVGDLAKPALGLSAIDRETLRNKVDHFFHVAAIYDLKASEESQAVANIDGTRHAITCAQDMGAGCFHHVSSVAVSGLYPGTFSEDMFEEAENLDTAYFRTKHLSEKVVRDECQLPWRIYRPSGVLGHSRTGEIDKIDGPYYSFPLIKKMGRLPRWLKLPGIASGSMNMVTVDYVVDAMDYIAHQPGHDGGCFHLTNTQQYDVTQVTNMFARLAGGASLSDNVQLSPSRQPLHWLFGRETVQRTGFHLLERMSLPRDIVTMVRWETRYDSSETRRALVGSGIEVPDLETIAATLWGYWEKHLA